MGSQPPDGHALAHLLLVLAAILAATKLLGALAERFKQPSVLGELIAGVLLGSSVLHVVDPADPVLHGLSQIGVIILLFSVGLRADVKALLKVGGTATTVAAAGVVLPFVLGYGVAIAFGVTHVAALVCGAVLTATSVGISTRVLREVGALDTNEGRVVLGAAVIDDVIGLVVLSVVTVVVSRGTVSVASVAQVGGAAVAFVIVAMLMGGAVARAWYGAVQRFKTSGTLGLMALAFAFALAWLADVSGSAMIIGAFIAGLVLDDRHDRPQIERTTEVLGQFFVPIFFATVGVAVDLRALADLRTLAIGGVLIGCGIAGKVAAGYAPVWFRGNKLLVGVAMVPRGEVGLIFAQMGLASAALNAGEFGAIMLMVMTTTVVIPPLLAVTVKRAAGASAFFADDDSAVELAAAAWPDEPIAPRGTPRSTKMIRPK